jgi:hypothetical protein
MTTRVTVTLAFTGYWIAGTGMARGRDSDVVTYRDRQSLPAMPMTQVKGQLRETAQRLAAGGVGPWSEPGLVTRLFGGRGEGDDPGLGGGPDAALAFRGEARLPSDLRAWLVDNDRGAELFVRLAATAIGERGAAVDHTLRAVEAVVPLTLEGKVEWIAADPPLAHWTQALDLACAATLAFGKLKADGYGRVIARVRPA